MIKTATQILADIAEAKRAEEAERHRRYRQRHSDPNLLARPLKSPEYPGQKRKNRYPLERKRREIVTRLCEVPECGRKHHSRGYCPKHLYRWLTYGDPLKLKQGPVSLGKIEGLG